MWERFKLGDGTEGYRPIAVSVPPRPSMDCFLLRFTFIINRRFQSDILQQTSNTTSPCRPLGGNLALD